MKKIKTKHIIIFIIVLLLFSYFRNVRHLKVKVVTTEEDKKLGLMFRQHLNMDEGMLFTFKYGDNSVWMKNTYIPLDILFIKEDTIVDIRENTTPLSLTKIKSSKPYTIAIEVNAGYCKKNNIKIGDKIQIKKM